MFQQTGREALHAFTILFSPVTLKPITLTEAKILHSANASVFDCQILKMLGFHFTFMIKIIVIVAQRGVNDVKKHIIK
ncbi:MAG: hypothetical protein ICV78_28735 [Tolypothrix sp. Co-bin9]|nr:hypothetical protein [Tolypothrix sp. Co-bin9]